MDRVSRNGYSALVNGEHVRLSHAYGPRYEKLGYEPAVHQILDEVVGEGMVVLDIGAHVGLHALLAGRRVGPDGRVFAFEPAPQTADLLERHIHWNGLEGRVEAVRAVVSDAVGVTAFFVNGATMAASIHEGNLATAREAFAGPTEEILCERTTVDAFCADRGSGRTSSSSTSRARRSQSSAVRRPRSGRASPSSARCIRRSSRCWDRPSRSSRGSYPQQVSLCGRSTSRTSSGSSMS